MALSIEDVVATLNGHEIQGWSDDSDFLMFPEAKKHNNTRVGGAGDRFRTSNPERRGGPVAIKLLPDGHSVPFMGRHVEMSKNRMGAEFIFSVHNRANGESVQCTGGIMDTAPDWHTYGKGDVKNLVYVIDYVDIKGAWDGVSYS